ncbi:MAG TPA: nuclear transport factor 2 family protein [Dongiaceae bacterium]|nr:nuclear transport factor 2 family protein [Dongiaceae bacterium]
MDAAQKIQVVEKYLLAVSTDNLDLIREIYADNATVEDPVGTPAKEGIDAILAFYGSFKGLGVKLKANGSVKCAGNACAFPFTAQIGPRTLDIIDVFEFDKNGKVVSMKAYWSA